MSALQAAMIAVPLHRELRGIAQCVEAVQDLAAVPSASERGQGYAVRTSHCSCKPRCSLALQADPKAFQAEMVKRLEAIFPDGTAAKAQAPAPAAANTTLPVRYQTPDDQQC